ncbi:GH92 family glycosyl hydrolase [Lentzea flaviverrucosa]|uniref:Alpha-1,2-mannosidase, putative n=1 Tax=Lentzea flaviverrucosa TaxID=200379 RepID=A0A1H9XXH7_9PSEU|nr:GH92 family glycosyl hydrolase [Lentzea flaviverrucosa]RDI17149.1 putative alpha-1,2-mannosidase [Lentzea flaviverrucosa]SES50779.1 alpha-1,2-mannosidase, putative [Lentzea flaviverrucosa]
MRALPVFLVTVLTAALATPASAAVRDDTRYVDPLIGSAGGGNTYPGAVRPFGMISWSPTSTRGDQTNTGAANGYAYDATRVRGFSLTHVNGAGCHPGAAGDIPIMPHVGEITSSPTADTKDQIFASDFSHADEKAEAGRYRVGLKSGATADLSVTTRAGVGEFTFPVNGSLLFRTSNSLNGSEDADITIDPATNTVSGSVLTGAFCGRRANGGTNNQKTYYRLHFTASFDRPISAHGTWVNSELRPGSTTASGGEGYLTGSARAGKGSGGYVSFADKQVRMRVGISYTSLDAAKRNLATEIPKRATVADVAKEAKKAWAKQLRAVEVDGGTADERTIFYTALYHTFLQPNVISDVGQATRYGNFSGWDQYRAHTQLLALLAPDVASGYAQSLLQTSRENGGVWDRWVHITGPTHVMTGDPSAPAIAGMYAMGAKNFDVRAAYESLLRQATVPHPDGLSDKGCPGQCEGQRPNLAEYMRLGYAPHDTCHCWGGAAETLEDSVADQALADLGRRLGRPSEEMEERAGWWRNTFNPATGHQQARKADGTWVTPFNPASDQGFAQGSSATYTWMVPHDVQGLAEAMGGKDVAASRLDGFFKRPDGSWATGGDALRYDPTNEPGIHTPWIYNELGQPRKTQETVRAMARLVYRTGPSGLPGNDDLGTMSAWYVFAALGLYPRTPSSAELHVSSPMFPKARITAKNITVLATGTPGVYVQETRWNGRRVDQPWLPEAFVEHGGVLVSRLEG